MSTMAQIGEWTDRIIDALKADGHSPRPDSKRSSKGRFVVVVHVVDLDESTRLTFHVDNNKHAKIHCSVGDGYVQLQGKSWSVKRMAEAIAWMTGYAAGYRRR